MSDWFAELDSKSDEETPEEAFNRGKWLVIDALDTLITSDYNTRESKSLMKDLLEMISD